MGLLQNTNLQQPTAKIIPFERSIKLFDEPVSAGPGNFLTGDHYEMITVGNEVPSDADFVYFKMCSFFESHKRSSESS
jgi:hypothetical protein